VLGSEEEFDKFKALKGIGRIRVFGAVPLNELKGEGIDDAMVHQQLQGHLGGRRYSPQVPLVFVLALGFPGLLGQGLPPV
jgi:hypothetical protein